MSRRERAKRPRGDRSFRHRHGALHSDMANHPSRWLAWSDVAACLVVGTLASALYVRSMAFEFTRTDDKVLILDDAPFISKLDNLGQAFSRPFFAYSQNRSESYYRPLVTLSLMLDAARGGTKPGPYHLTNVVLHVLASMLLVLALRAMGFARPLALGGAAVFAVHPALTEAVAWIPGRCDILLGVFVLIGVIAFLRYLTHGALWAAMLHGVAFLGALWTKESALVLPGMLAIGLFLVGRRRAMLLKAPLLFAWAIPLAIWAWTWARASTLGDDPLRSRLTVAITHVPVLLVYLGKVIAPIQLAVLATWRDSSILTGALALPLMALMIRGAHGQHRTMALGGMLWFVAFLLPSLPVSDLLILETRLYVPALGIVALALAAFTAFYERLITCVPAYGQRSRTRHGRAWGAGACAAGMVVLILGLGLSAWRYSEAFQNSDSFTRAAVAGSPHSGLAQLNRGVVLQLRGELEQAEHAYLRAHEFEPGLAVVQNNLGLIQLHRGDLIGAEKLFRSELSIDPGYAKAHFNLGLVLQRMGHIDEAIESVETANRMNPEDIQTLQQLHMLNTIRGRVKQAAYYERLLSDRGAQTLKLQRFDTAILHPQKVF